MHLHCIYSSHKTKQTSNAILPRHEPNDDLAEEGRLAAQADARQGRRLGGGAPTVHCDRRRGGAPHGDSGEFLGAFERTDVVVGAVGESAAVAQLSAQCGGFDVASKLELALKRMTSGEKSELSMHKKLDASPDEPDLKQRAPRTQAQAHGD